MLLLLLKEEKLFFLNESKFSVMDKKLLNLFKFFKFWSFIAFQNSNVGIWISYVFNQIYLILKRNLTNVEYTVNLYLRYFNITWCINYVDNFGHSHCIMWFLRPWHVAEARMLLAFIGSSSLRSLRTSSRPFVAFALTISRKRPFKCEVDSWPSHIAHVPSPSIYSQRPR